MSLTEAGNQFYHYAKQSLQDYSDIKEQLLAQKDEVIGRLRITCPDAFYETCLLNIVTEFMQRYSKLRLEVNLTTEFLDLQAQQIDIAIRTANPQNTLYHVQPLTMSKRGIFAAPATLKNTAFPNTPVIYKNIYV